MGGAPGEGATLFARGAAAAVIAASGTADGSLIQWVNTALPAGGGAALPPKMTLSDAAAASTRKTALKTVSLARPAFVNLAKGVSATAAPVVDAITAVARVPSGAFFLVGTSQGAIRLYDGASHMTGGGCGFL